MKKLFLILTLFLSLTVINNATAQNWSAVGTGTDASVRALVTFNNELYAGGHFSMADGSPANKIAKWNGATWSALGLGLDGNLGSGVYALAVYNGELYAGGDFTIAGGNSVNYIAKWNGAIWSAVGTGMSNPVRSLAVYNGELYAGGSFNTAGGNAASKIAKWNGTTWSAVGTGMNSTVLSLAVYNGELYAGGLFTTADGNSANNIAKWNGTTWSAIGTGTNDRVDDFHVFNNELYIGGWFTMAGGNPANYIAKWNGTNWLSLGSGMNADVFAISSYGGEIFAGGSFTTAGSNPVSYVAKWDGINWSMAGAGMGVGTGTTVLELDVYNGELYAGGGFTTADGYINNYIAKWSNCSAAPSISGEDTICSGEIITLSASGGGSYLWDTGETTSSINIDPTATTTYILTSTQSATCYNSISKKVVVKLSPPIPTIQHVSNFLASNSATNNQWYVSSNIIPNENGQFYTPTQDGDYVVCVTSANGCSSCSLPYTFTFVGIQVNNLNTFISPNPFSTHTTLQTGKVFTNATLTLYNSLGQQVRQVNNISGQTLTLHRDNLVSGLYYLQLTQDNQTIATDKLLITDN